MVARSRLRCIALILALGAPFTLAAQSDLADPDARALRALDGFELAGDSPEGVANEILPCGRGNAYGSWFMSGLVEREWTEGREEVIAEAFGRIPWALCRDRRIDGWLSAHLLSRLRAGERYELFWQAVIDRRAPDSYRVWEEISEDPGLPAEILFRASRQLRGRP